ncbi:HotDog domain-containing protein [Gaertneriomyces semiglobifer]|nr:HotDog domain-containing protein [Gaertneriomyces semiglobifer]
MSEPIIKRRSVSATAAIVRRRMILGVLSAIVLINFKRLKSHPKFLAALVLLFNLRSLPFAHHIRFAYQVVLTRLFNRPKFVKLAPEQRLWAPCNLAYRVLPDDMDWNLHMNNASYNKHLDFARTDWAVSVLGDLVRKYTPMNAGVCCWFKKELSPFEKFVIESSLLSYEEKWFYVQHRFVTYSNKGKQPVVHCVAVSKLVLKETSGKTLPFPEAVKQLGIVDDTARRERGKEVMEMLMMSEEGLTAFV